MKIRGITALLIWSEDYQALAKWYTEKLGATINERIDHPKDTGYGLDIGNSYLWIGRHSKVIGKNKDPYRIMFNIEVDSVREAHNELEAKGVEFIAKPFKAPTFDKYFATFKDLDGNIVQFIGNL